MLKSFAVPSGRDYSLSLRRWFRRETSESHAVDTPQCTAIFNVCAIFVLPIIRLMYHTSDRLLADRYTHQYCDVLHQPLRILRCTCKVNPFMNMINILCYFTSWTTTMCIKQNRDANAFYCHVQNSRFEDIDTI